MPRVLAIILATFVLGTTANGQLTDVQKEQLADFEKYIKSKDVNERVAQVGFLEHIDGVESARLLLEKGLTDKEVRVRARAIWALARKEDDAAIKLIQTEGLTAKKPNVREGAVLALGRMEDERNEDAIVQLLQAEKKPLVLIAALRALARTSCSKAIEGIDRFLTHRDTGVVCAALYMVGETEEPEHAKSIWGLLMHKRWEVQSSTLQALGRLRSKESVPFILDYFTQAEGRLQGDCRDCLMKITQRQYGHNPETWMNWWKRVEKHWTVPDTRDRNADDAAKYGVDDETPTFHEIRTRSKHIAFVIDVSSSMVHSIRYKVKNRKTSTQDYRMMRRIDLAKEELARIVGGLKKKKNTYFNIVAFETNVKMFKKSSVKASPGSVAEALKWIKGLQPYRSSEGSAQYTKEGWKRGETNTFGALRYIYGFKDGKATSFTGRLKPIADTVFFLSDGDPTAGYLTTRDEIIDQIERYHGKGQVVIHTIAYDLTGVGRQLMSDIARLTGGKFVEIGAKR